MKVGIVRFPGSNCDDDAGHALGRVLGESVAFLWHEDGKLDGVDAVLLPGGFSYGDYLRAGALAARSPILDAVRRFALRGGPVLGICNGFQMLCETGLLEGALLRNRSLRFICKDIYVRVEGRPTPFSEMIPAGHILKLPIAHAQGRYFHERPETLFDRGMVVFRYVDEAGGVTESANPNGSVSAIAGIANETGNVLGLMPHPERACERELGGEDGRLIFDSLKRILSGARA